MDRKEIEKELDSEEYQLQVKRLDTLQASIMQCLIFCYLNSIRDGVSQERNFFLRMFDDIYQSVVSITILAKEGISNTCLRELRFLVEVSIKSCLIVKNTKRKTFEEQISEYEKLLNSTNINPINTLTFNYLKPDLEEDFKIETKRLYGHLSKYTHSSSHQLIERLNRAEMGRTIGFEGTNELKQLNDDIERVYAVVIVFVFHSVGQYVAGDFLVESNGETIDWYFNQSKFVSKIDENFDYKHERKMMLKDLRQKRKERIKF